MEANLKPARGFRVYDTLANAQTGVATLLAAGHVVKAIRAGASGTLRLTDDTGTTSDLAFEKAERQDVVIRALTASGSTGCAPLTVFFDPAS